MTKQRAAIMKVLRENKGHFTAEEIFELSKKIYPGIVRATIYNNLNSMVEESLVRRICQSGKPDIYERNEYPHAHHICTDCGKICDVTVDKLKTYLSEVLNCPVDDYDLIIHCKCLACRTKKI